LQRSILRDAISILGSHYLAKRGIMVVRDIERVEMPFIAKALGCKQVSSPDLLTKDKLGEAKVAEEIGTAGGRIVKITGVKNPGKTVSILLRGSNNLICEEAERSIHDALCVVRCLVKQRFLLPGGGAPEAQLSVRLADHANTLGGLQSYCVRAFADALEVVPYTLAENAGLNPIEIVTKLRAAHAKGEKAAGIDIKKGDVSDMLQGDVIQPLLVTTSAINLATEFVRMLLKVDDIVQLR